MSMLTMGKRVTAWAMVTQNPPAEAWGPSSENLVRKGMVRKFTLGPSSDSTAGKSVNVAARAAITTRIAPQPKGLEE